MSETVTITLTRYREPDWLVRETLASLAAQEAVAGEVIFLDQNWSESFAKEVADFSTEQLCVRAEPCEEKGLSHARNLGLDISKTDIVLFIDPDAIASPKWAAKLAQALNREGVAVAGSRILPEWKGRRPLVTRSRVVLDQYSVLDWGEGTIDAPRVVGAGFGVCKSAAPTEIYFDEALGRRDGKLFGGEESDLCERIRAKGLNVIYCGGAIVYHQILPERLSWRWALQRLYFAGLGRAQRGGTPSPAHRPGFWDFALLPVILPFYLAGYLRARLFCQKRARTSRRHEREAFARQ
ncbi:glycosyltransferase [Hyphococcus flavus]|uniref:Glycosyltransferase n=1 Tax=Hyphococcus flavus TaxID=1866326 RepID=A0AAE9ZHF0_9PROT|nr:glycosyltransferase [Hyphococcus flavus]WDI33123.1 glycosyltransferase [Hyphococcus flavus]